MTIEQYLQGKVDFNLNETTLAAILYDRGVTAGTAMASVSEKQKDLCLADIYMFLATSSTSTSGEYESDGGWQRQRANKNVVDKGTLRALAQALYKKWGENVDATAVGKVVLKNLYD